jgi:hypothetical protein
VPYQTIIGVFDAVTETEIGGTRRPLFAEPVLVNGADGPPRPEGGP